MKKAVKYESVEKSYDVKKKKKLKIKMWFFVLVLPAMMLGVLSFLCLSESISFSNKENSISYNEKGKVDYKVYLKENDYYNKPFLNSGMQYIASLINTINVDFNYEIHSTDYLKYNYKYKIDAKLVITDRNDESKILYQKDENLLEEKSNILEDNNFVINEDIDIDYGKYNEYVSSFKSDYGLNVNSDLIVTMTVETLGNTDKLSDKLDGKKELQISIPLSEQTLDITMNTKEINNQGLLSGTKTISITSPIILVSGIVFLVLTIILFAIAIYLYVINKSNPDIYEKEIKKLLKSYDRLIVTSKRPNINETDFSKVIRVMTIEELIDAYEATQKPIIYYEVIPGEKSYFVIMSDDVLYKLTITRAYLQKQLNEKKGIKN